MSIREYQARGNGNDGELARQGRRHASLWILLGLMLFLAACETFPGKYVGGECRASRNIELKDRLDRAISLLSDDKFCRGRAEVVYYLRHNPRSAIAKKLLFAIDTNARKHYGKRAFDYKVKRGDSLAGLSERYLGDMLLFPMLARYNDIEANNLHAGAIIRIPNGPITQARGPSRAPKRKPTPVQLASIEPAKPSDADMQRMRDLIDSGEQLRLSGDSVGAYDAFHAAAAIDSDAPAVQMRMSEVSDAAADYFHRKAVEAIRDQHPDLAIVFWRRVLEITPNHPHAPAGLERAEAIVSSMAKFRD